MQTQFPSSLLSTEIGREADAILRRCVHCGFCNATCPTYQLTGDELDGPRGRIYLIKRLFENQGKNQSDGVTTLTHLDRCLTCRSCETTCPSGVEYGHLLDLGREQIEQQVSRPIFQKIFRWALSYFLSRPDFLRLGLVGARVIQVFLPASLRNALPVQSSSTSNAAWPEAGHVRQMILLQGCAQRVIEPGINVATAKVLDLCSISVIRVAEEVCCGALDQHLTKTEKAEEFMRRNIDAWWPHVEQGVEAIVCTASACGLQIKDYGHYLRRDDLYAKKAKRISALAKDISEVLNLENILPDVLAKKDDSVRVAFHAPCTLQHGLQLNGVVEDILRRCGFEILPVADSHLCCGSAGTYSILNPGLAEPLRSNKLTSLQAHQPDVITSANIGCIQHLKKGSSVPVQHWIELLADCQPA
jgi:glycolate oxidase iron-sulfur subunit